MLCSNNPRKQRVFEGIVWSIKGKIATTSTLVSGHQLETCRELRRGIRLGGMRMDSPNSWS
jgi:hypothetical protein